MKTKLLIACLVCIALAMLPSKSNAQDFHLSQYDITPHYMNPALVGMYMGDKADYRINANYRSQWQKLNSKPYSSAALSYDRPFGRFGVGAYIMDNLAGLSNFNTFNFIVGGAYQITSKESRQHYLTTGLQLGVLHKKYSDEDLIFGTQYDNRNGLDPTLPSGEAFQKFSLVRLDANLGIYYKFIDKNKKYNPFGGFSIYHLNKPNQSVTGIKSQVNMRFNLNLGTDININEQVVLQPNFLFMYQGKAKEFNLGMLAFYKISNSQNKIIGGFGWRYKDAIVLHIGLKQGYSTFRMSYDIITNYLNTFGGKRGAIEMGVVYSGITKVEKTVF